MFRTITARYAGQCKRCRQSFEAGERIRFGGYGRTYHLSAKCPAATAAQQLTAADEPDTTEDEPQQPVQPVTQPQPLPVLEANIIADEPADEPSGYFKGVHWSDPAADVDSAF